MYRDILTMCWSIKEVNKNLSDRKSVTDYSIKYLKNACSELAGMIREIGMSMPGEAIDVADKKGQIRRLSLNDVSEMLYDARKIVELNLIDNIDRWARMHLEREAAGSS
ncbi:MAG: hypothetical protein QUS09_01410 [Methanotrichaceae archaeon]|nr:hypothetical protein [Methanotrichaceae archaeon]